MAKSDEKDKQVKGVQNKKADKKKDKAKKPNFFVRVGRKIKEVCSELKRVTWPTFPAALKATGVVIAIVAIFLIITTGVNFGFSKLLELLTNMGA